MSFDAGLMLGLSMCAMGSGGDVDTPEHDGDYQKWLDLPEPNDNQAIYLANVVDLTVKITVLLPTTISDDAYSIDWGDGSELEYYANDVYIVSHEYSATGEYIIKFTTYVDTICNYCMLPSSMIVMAKYGDKMCTHESWQNGMRKTRNFQSCNNLRYIRLPPSTEFYNSFFSNCYALRKIEFDGVISQLYQYMFQNCHVLDFDNLKFGDITEIPYGCFFACRAIKNLSFPNCTIIAASAFAACYGLSKISFPSCTTFAARTFSGCFSLKTAKIDNCISLGDGAFQGCEQLSDITISDNCTFGTDCFKDCYCLYPKPDGSI